MIKVDLIRTLEKVRLVLGNGFDLHCQLSCSYKHYFIFYRKKYEKIGQWFSKYIESFDNGWRFFNSNVDFDFCDYNVWDFFFAFEKMQFLRSDNLDWCDIERFISDSLQKEDPSTTCVNWEKVYKVYANKTVINDQYLDAMAYIIRRMDGRIFESLDAFFHFILNQLKRFELNFGHFILSRQENVDDYSFQIGLKNEKFDLCSTETINQLCNPRNVLILDTFNFSNISLQNYPFVINHINGDVRSPIFGIDSTMNPNDERYIFTKTYRRIEMNMNSNTYTGNRDCENLIIYGHSLNEADHNYFFSILDELNILSTNLKRRIVFGYSVYDDKNKDQILYKIKKSAANLIYKYAIYKGLKYPERLFDLLYFQKKIIMYNVPVLSGEMYCYHNFFDVQEDEK